MAQEAPKVAADTRPWDKRSTALMGGYAVASLTLTGLYPFLPGAWQDVDPPRWP